MKRQGEVEAEYHAAHTYIQQLQDEISQVLDGILTTADPPSCSSTPSLPHRLHPPPPPSDPAPATSPSLPRPNAPHPSPTGHVDRTQTTSAASDSAGRKPFLEDVTNVLQASHKTRTVSGRRDPPSSPKQQSRSFDAELYWTGRRIAVEGSGRRSSKDGSSHGDSFGGRRRTSLGEYYGERQGDGTALGKRAALLAGYRRSSLGEYESGRGGAARMEDIIELGGATRKVLRGELEDPRADVISAEQGKCILDEPCNHSPRKALGEAGDDLISRRLAEVARAASKEKPAPVGEGQRETEEHRACKISTSLDPGRRDSKDGNKAADLSRRARELRNSITESIDKRRRRHSGGREPRSSTQSASHEEPSVPGTEQRLSRDQPTALCPKTKDSEASSNRVSTSGVQGISQSSSSKAPAKVASLCCVNKQEKEKDGEGTADRERPDHQPAKEAGSSGKIQGVGDVSREPASSCRSRTVTQRVISDQEEVPPQPLSGSTKTVSRSQEPWPPSRSDASQPALRAAESLRDEGVVSSDAVQNVLVRDGPLLRPTTEATTSGRLGWLEREVDDVGSGSVGGLGVSGDGDGGSERSVSRCGEVGVVGRQGHVRGTEVQGHVADAEGTQLQDRVAGARGTQLQRDSADVRNSQLRGRSADVRDRVQGHTDDVRDTELQGHADDDVRDTQLQGHGGDAGDAELQEQKAGTCPRPARSGQQRSSLQPNTVPPPMLVCEQGVHPPLPPQSHRPTDLTLPPCHSPLATSLPCAAEGRERGGGGGGGGGPNARQLGPALEPPSHREHHDPQGDLDLLDLGANGPLPQREKREGAGNARMSSSAARQSGSVGDEDFSRDADLLKAAWGEGDSEAPTSSLPSMWDATRTSSSGQRSDKDAGLGKEEEEESAGGSHRQRDPAQYLADSLHLDLPPAVQSRDAEVQTLSGGALSPAHLLPHVDTACQTSPTADSALSAGSSGAEDLSGNRLPSAGRSGRRTPPPPAADREMLVRGGSERGGERAVQEDLGRHSVSNGLDLERAGASCGGRSITDRLSGNHAAHFGTSDEDNRSGMSSSDSKKQTSGQREEGSRKQKKGEGKSSTDHRHLRHHSQEDVNNRSDQRTSLTPDEGLSRHPKLKRSSSDNHQERQAQGRRSDRPQAAGCSPKPGRSSAKRTPSVEKKQGQENFSFLPDEVPEMQVMVNSLTPVLQRRKSARRSNSHSGVSSSEDVTSGAEDLHQMLASFTAAPSEHPKERWEDGAPGHQDSWTSLTSSPASSSQPDKAREEISARPGGLFLKPKFARTWHGPVALGRAAPKMGVTMMTSDPSALTSGPSAARGGSGYSAHVHTMPVISRTLLDALHKRYCGYQYGRGGRWAPTAAPSLPAAPPPPPPPPAAPASAATPPLAVTSSSSQVGMAVVRKLNSEGESEETGGSSSLGTSSESSPRTPHTQAATTVVTAGPTSDTASAASSSLQKHNGQAKKQEIEAVEACQWLRAAGFPQYAQMFEDGLFPVDVGDVQRDHDFLDSDSIQSVVRRLNILNTCSVMKIDAQPCKKAPEESDEEDQCALSSNWEYQKAVRRWSRKLEPELSITEDLNLEPSSSRDSLLGEDSGSHTDESPVLESKMPHSTTDQEQAPGNVRIQVDAEPSESIDEGLIQQDTHVSSFPISPKLRRAASERLKSALKKMESFKKKSKKYPTNRNIVEISDPVVSDQEGMQAKLERLNCVDINSGQGTPTPHHHLPLPSQESTPKDSVAKGASSPDSSYFSPLSPISPAPPAGPASLGDQTINSSASSQVDSSSLSEYYSAHSQLLASFQACSETNRQLIAASAGRKNSDSSLVEIFLLPQDHKPGSFPRLLKNGYIDTTAHFQGPPNQTSSASSLPQGLRGNAAGSTPLSSRVSVYDNLSPGSPQRTFSPSDLRKPEDKLDALSSSARQSQVLRSFSISSGNQDIKPDIDMSSFAGMVRSRSASAATSLEHQALGIRRGSDGANREVLGGSVSSERKLSVGMEELDAMLQNLFRDINSLNSDLTDEADSQDTLAVDSFGGVSQREVSFSIEDHNGSFSTHSVHSNAGSSKEEGQLEGDSLALTTSSPSGVDDSMEGEEGDMSSQDSGEEIEGSADETLERIILEAHERRDSGVGSSLTRASRERTRKKIRWESFQKCHRPSRASRELQIGGLSVCQLLPLRQLSLLKLTSIMEKCSSSSRSQWSWSVPRFMKRHKAPQFSDKNVFGVPFTVMLQRTGQPLPQCVLYAMRYLRRTSHDAIGIFRKSGVRSRIQKLRDMVEACPDTVNFDELQPYDVADLLKQYFRELPECLLTNKLSDTFRSIFSHVPVVQRLEALQTAVVLLPEENREVLHCLLLFLGDIAAHADKHQMNASNLAVCFAPSLFNFLGSHGTNSPKRQRRGLGVPEQRELLEQKAVHECFTYMIVECKKLFMVPPSMYSRLHLSTLSNMEPVHLDEFYAKGKQPGPDYKAFGEEHIQILLKEAHDKNRGWAPVSVSAAGIEVLQRKPQDGHPLRQWKCSVEIEAPPIEVLNRILHERHKWDDDMLSWNVVERLDRHSDVFHYVLNSMAPHPPRHFMVIRYWRPDLVKGACALVSRSVEHSGWQGASEADYDQGVRAVELGSYHLMEPCGSGRSRVTYISRTDMRGRCPEWYNRVFGHMSANYLDRLRDSFRQDAEGPETKV